METKTCKGPCGLEKPVSEFYDSRQGRAVYKFSVCKSCCTSRTQSFRQTPENKARWAEYAHNTQVRKYGIEPEQYRMMLDEQAGVCAICKQPNQDGKRLPVDHSMKQNVSVDFCARIATTVSGGSRIAPNCCMLRFRT